MPNPSLPTRVVRAIVRRDRGTTAIQKQAPQVVIDAPDAEQPEANGSATPPPVVIFIQQNVTQTAPTPTGTHDAVNFSDLRPPPVPARSVVDPETILGAARLRRPEVTRLLSASYPMVYRLISGLTGSEPTATRGARRVVRRSFRAMRRWTAPAQAQQWFIRQSVLMSRHFTAKQSRRKRDCLVGTETGQYAAFVRALRELPYQQAEALLLHYGERLDPRQLAIAMDCSITASGNHLVAGKKQLESLAGDDAQGLWNDLARRYVALEPTPTQVRTRLRGPIVRNTTVRKLGRILAALTLIATLVAVGLLARHFWPMLSF